MATYVGAPREGVRYLHDRDHTKSAERFIRGRCRCGSRESLHFQGVRAQPCSPYNFVWVVELLRTADVRRQCARWYSVYAAGWLGRTERDGTSDGRRFTAAVALSAPSAAIKSWLQRSHMLGHL